jgi:DNA-binding transcriptional LysR family regulator
MDRFRRVAQLWNWLPAFRGVAEHENPQRAASVLGVSASALSRTVKLLEDALGAEVFVRQSGASSSRASARSSSP